MKLNLGCGSRKEKGYINIDSNAGCKPDRVYDIKRIGRHFAQGSIEEIRMVHALEHFSQQEGLSLLRSCFSLLQEGGVLYLEMPDLAGVCAEYAKVSKPCDPIMKQRLFGQQNNQFDFHKWGYSYNELKQILQTIGFKTVTSKRSGLSDNHQGPCFGLRARK